MRPRYLLALLLLIPLLDSLVLVLIVGSGLLTWLQTVALVVLTGLLGMLLVRAEGRNTIVRFQRKVATGGLPTDELLDGGLLIAAGAFLLTPGLVTDLIGFLLAIPVSRMPIRAALKRWVVVPYIDKQTGGLGTGKVWTFGFPDPEQASDGGNPFDVGGAPGGPTSGSPDGTNGQDGEDFVDVDFEQVDDESDRNERSDS
ncbi:MAG: FxsA family protein [Halohasta sp.]